MEFTAFASGSAGNLYRVSNGASSLLIEAGLPLKQIRQALDFRLSEIRGVCLTHEHMDHARGAADVMKAGADLFCTAGTADALGLSGHRLHIIEPLRQFSVGTWTVLPFPVDHDAAQPVGYLLASGDAKALYLTDAPYCRYTFQGLTHIALEVNYSLDILDENVASGAVAHELRNRIRKSHMSLETALDLLRANDLSCVEGIHLLHLSDANSDAERFRREVQALTGKPTYIA